VVVLAKRGCGHKGIDDGQRSDCASMATNESRGKVITRTPIAATAAAPTNSGSSGDAVHGGVQLRLVALDLPNVASQFHYVPGFRRWFNLVTVE
jgi:hypothetical protein